MLERQGERIDSGSEIANLQKQSQVQIPKLLLKAIENNPIDHDR